MPETLEAEVIAIDGVAPAPAAEPVEEKTRGPAWSSLAGTLLKLDRRWWPLWLVLGILVIGVALVVGVIFLVGAIALGTLKTFWRMLTGGGRGPSGGSIRPWG